MEIFLHDVAIRGLADGNAVDHAAVVVGIRLPEGGVPQDVGAELVKVGGLLESSSDGSTIFLEQSCRLKNVIYG